jgi:hypothetical protein
MNSYTFEELNEKLEQAKRTCGDLDTVRTLASIQEYVNSLQDIKFREDRNNKERLDKAATDAFKESMIYYKQGYFRRAYLMLGIAQSSCNENGCGGLALVREMAYQCDKAGVDFKKFTYDLDFAEKKSSKTTKRSLKVSRPVADDKDRGR